MWCGPIVGISTHPQVGVACHIRTAVTVRFCRRAGEVVTRRFPPAYAAFVSSAGGWPGPGTGLWHTAGVKADLRIHQGGSGEPVLLLLHGLGATGDVWEGWRPLLARRWPGRWLAPDLPGSRRLPATIELHLRVPGRRGRGHRRHRCPHCRAGTLAGRGRRPGPCRRRVRRAGAGGHRLGIKVAWTEDELDRARAAARRSPAWFASRDEAVARYVRISGLAGLLDAAGPAVDAGLHEQRGRWRLAMDPGAFAVGAPDMTQLLARCRARVTLARGEHDAMNTDDQLTRLGVPTVTLPGLGHNAHVENPHLSSTLLDPHRHPIDQPA
jgi:pimeloyl-ACP methyl ester carboxylesterase